MNLKPLKDRVLISYVEEAEKSAGGIYIPDAAKEKPQRGKVEAIGGEVKEVKVGNEILFSKYAGDKFKVGTKDMLILKEEEILGVIS
ncbi:MAG: co-chaperone GroES [Nitrospirota bacterium]|nr:co-chaperone GroES [Nitrospirota bacterium]